MNIRWYDLSYIRAAAQVSGDHVRQDWIDDAGAYAPNLPPSLVTVLERIDWRAVTPADVETIECSLHGADPE